MRSRSGWVAVFGFGILALALGGCGSLSGGHLGDTLVLAAPTASLGDASAEADRGAGVGAALVEEPPETLHDTGASDCEDTGALVALAGPADGDGAEAPAAGPSLSDGSPLSLVDPTLVAQVGDAQSGARRAIDDPIEEYDPLEKFNEVMFAFNLKLDRYVIKPVAKAYNFITPDELQRMINRAFTNLNFVPRMINSLLQGKFAGAGRELARFLVNSVAGIGGLWDIAKQELNIEPSRADFGQTLGKWGSPPGPYLILPFMPPLTFRDGIGVAVDGFMDPLGYFLPFIWERLVMKILDTVNDRSLNLELFQGFEETTVDFYSAVRNGYLQRRYRLIHED